MSGTAYQLAIDVPNVTPQSMRSLSDWASSRGPGEELAEAIEYLIEAIYATKRNSQ